MTDITPPETPTWRLRLERFPVRRAIQWVLGIFIIWFVVAGSVATLQTGRFSAEDWAGLFVNGVARGSVYALIALGYTLVYGILFLINFAHGEVFMFGAFAAFFAGNRTRLQRRARIADRCSGSSIILDVSMLVSMTVAVLLERIAYRPLRSAPRLVPLITAIGASLFLQYTARGLFGANVPRLPADPIAPGLLVDLRLRHPRAQVVVIVGAILLWLALFYLHRPDQDR